VAITSGQWPADADTLVAGQDTAAGHDADLVRTLAAEAERILVVGGGWVAASLRMLGHQVTVALRGLSRPRSVPIWPRSTAVCIRDTR
jgi:hypothetical protein